MNSAWSSQKYSQRLAAEGKSLAATLLTSSAFYLLRRVISGDAAPPFSVLDLLSVVVSYGFFTVLFEHPVTMERLRQLWSRWLGDMPRNVTGAGSDFSELRREILHLRSEIAHASGGTPHRRELLRVARFEIIGELITGFQHELNNHLMIVVGSIALLNNPDTTSEAKAAAMERIDHAVDSASQMVRRTASLFEDVAVEREEILSVKEAIAEAIDMASGVWRTRAEVTGCRVFLNVDLSDGFVLADRNELRQVLLNLIVNAVDAMPVGGTITISSVLADGTVKISIEDTGIGMAPDVASRVFEPFFTTKAAAAGLGLTLARAIVERRGGRIECSARPKRGTIFSITLPSVEKPEPRTLLTRRPARSPGRGSREIVVVDDNADVVMAITGNLNLAGFRVTGFSNSQQALEHIVRHTESIAVLITDFAMPGMNGTVLAQRVRAVAPHIQIVLLTGLYVYKALGDKKSYFDMVISKPIDPEKLFAIVGELVR